MPVSKKIQTLKIDHLEAKACGDDIISALTTRRNTLEYFDSQVFGHACETAEARNTASSEHWRSTKQRQSVSG